MQLKKVELFTTNLQGVESFYSGVLNFPVLQKSAQTISFQVGYSVLTFQQTSAPVGIYHFAFLIPKNQVQAAYNWLKNHTPILPFTSEADIAEFANWNAQAFYFHDATGNILEMIAHHDLPYTNESEFSATSIIGLCEMGLVVDDVAAACKHLHHTYGVPYFTKGPFLPDFAVLGEEDGLLIVSTKGRGWLPTGQPAEVNRVKVSFSINGKEQELVL